MPNYVKNIVTFTGDEESIRLMKEFVKSDESTFDFDKIIPQPEELNLVDGSEMDVAVEAAQRRRQNKAIILKAHDKAKRSPEEWADLGEKYLENERKYGHRTWYGWRVENWGTKWPAMVIEWNENVVTFQTAWDFPEGVLNALSKKFPKIHIKCDFADEDIGRNCGTAEFEDGYSYVGHLVGDMDAVPFACDIWGIDMEKYLKECQE